MKKIIIKEDEILFEMLDYSALTFEMTLLGIAVITTLITSIGYGGIMEAINHYSYLGFISMIYIYTRESKFLYNFFYLKKFKLIFYKDRIIQTSTDKTFFLDTICESYNINMYFPAKSDNKIRPKGYKFAIFTTIIGFPISLPLLVLLTFVKILPALIIQRSLNVNSSSLVITFPEQKAINIPYGVLYREDICFFENYFKDFFEMKKLQKAFHKVPNIKGEENE